MFYCCPAIARVWRGGSGKLINFDFLRDLWEQKRSIPVIRSEGQENDGVQMTDKNQNFIDQNLQDLNDDGVDRRGFLMHGLGGYWLGLDLKWRPPGVSSIRQEPWPGGRQRWGLQLCADQ